MHDKANLGHRSISQAVNGPFLLQHMNSKDDSTEPEGTACGNDESCAPLGPTHFVLSCISTEVESNQRRAGVALYPLHFQAGPSSRGGGGATAPAKASNCTERSRCSATWAAEPSFWSSWEERGDVKPGTCILPWGCCLTLSRSPATVNGANSGDDSTWQFQGARAGLCWRDGSVHQIPTR